MENTITTYSASGKLMLFGEYLVLKGADCLAFPLKFGQTLSIEDADELIWESYSKDGLWFSASMSKDLEITETNNREVADILRQLFLVIQAEQPHLDFNQYFKAEANFDLNWGLGSSSTLISLLSQWSGVDPDILSDASFGGSGYDVACATAKGAIVYANGETKQEVHLPEAITEKMLFVYLGNKQNSREEIKRFNHAKVTPEDVQKINAIIKNSLKADTIEAFEKQLNDSERLIAPLIGMPELKQLLFSDYPYSTKYLGAWGGDFFLATYRDLKTAKNYFLDKGYDTIFTYNELTK